MKIQDQILYADILQCKKNGCELYYEDHDGILLKSNTSQILYCGANNEEGAKKIVAALPETFEILVAHDLYTDTYLKKERNLEIAMCCYHSAYLKKKAPIIQLAEGYRIEQLTIQHRIEIINMYRHSMESLATEEYITECLSDGMYGAFYEQELCGIIGVHAQESMGLLEVKEHHMRKGLGTALGCYLINKQMEKGRIPYGEIVEDNHKSLALSKKVGMETSDALTYWYFSS